MWRPGCAVASLPAPQRASIVIDARTTGGSGQRYLKVIQCTTGRRKSDFRRVDVVITAYYNARASCVKSERMRGPDDQHSDMFTYAACVRSDHSLCRPFCK